MFPNLSASIRRVVIIAMALIAVGAFLWLINTYVPMAQSIKDILNIVVVIATCVFVLQAVGLWPALVRFWDDVVTRRLPPQPRH
jgi:undecaprenyl pyrophosphate phosphatase UppP